MSSPNQPPFAIRDAEQIDRLDFDKGGGLVPVIAQHALDGTVLMLGYADAAALRTSLQSGRLTFFSRARQALWEKGETSGNTLRLVALHADCDGDAVLARVLPAGPTCHTGARACFQAAPTLAALAETLRARAREMPEDSYTTRLLDDRNLRLKKVGEETAELLVALADLDREDRARPPRGPSAAHGPIETAGHDLAFEGSGRVRAVAEAADLLYHLLVACQGAGIDLDDLLAELESRSASR